MTLPTPYEDQLTGACVRLNEVILLLTGQRWQAAAAQGDHLLSGRLALRYALPFLYDDDALIPRLVFDDHRQEHTGRELFTFVEKRGHAYPRADVVGVRVSGEPDEIRLRDLDLAEPLIVLVHSQDDDRLPAVRINTCVLLHPEADEVGWQTIRREHDAGTLPELLVENVPSFRLDPASLLDRPTLLESWLAGQS
jgi:hypothetical protein